MANSAYKDIADAIAAEVSAIPNLGQVHLWMRATVSLGKYLEKFRVAGGDGEDRIKGWMLTRERTSEEVGGMASETPGGFAPAGVNRRVYTFLLTGIYGLQDELGTELEMQESIEAICDRFRDSEKMILADGAGVRKVPTLERLFPPQLDVMEPRFFGPTLLHYAEIRIQAAERLNRD